jgi:hypothetical protein
LNQDPPLSVCVADPLVIDKFGAFVADPAVKPNKYTLANVASEIKPPVPDLVKLVTFDIDKTIMDATLWFNIILPVPKLIERTTALEELNIPVVKLKPSPRFSAPELNVYVPPVESAYDLFNITVPSV